MHATPQNMHLLDWWKAHGDGVSLPKAQIGELISTKGIAENIVIEFKSTDGVVRFAHCGSGVTRLLGLDLTGLPVVDTFPEREDSGVRALLSHLFRSPKIVLSHSTIQTLDHDLLQVEILMLPTIANSVGELVYVCGTSEFTRGDAPLAKDGRLQSRSILSRRIFDPIKLKEVDSPFAFPSRVADATSAA